MEASLKHNIPASLTDPLKPSSQGNKSCAPESVWASDPNASTCWMSGVGFIILAANCSAAIYRSWDDSWAVAFVLSSFAILLSLFCALHVFEKSPHGSPRRGYTKAAVWILSTVLTLMFSVRVAALMPYPAAVVVWIMAGSTISAGFFMFFLCPNEAAVSIMEEPTKVAGVT